VKSVGLLVAVGFSLGCASGHGAGGPPAPELRADPTEYASFLAGGDAVIEGRAFVRTRHGGTHYATGFPVYLDPVTSYSRQWQRRAELPANAEPPALDELFVRARQVAVAEEEGRFSFSGLAPGWYYIHALVVWDDGSLTVQSYVLRDSVLAQRGKTVTAVLTRVR
jgi:hypothetical protein